jgi:hypothetical protein
MPKRLAFLERDPLARPEAGLAKVLQLEFGATPHPDPPHKGGGSAHAG